MSKLHKVTGTCRQCGKKTVGQSHSTVKTIACKNCGASLELTAVDEPADLAPAIARPVSDGDDADPREAEPVEHREPTDRARWSLRISTALAIVAAIFTVLLATGRFSTVEFEVDFLHIANGGYFDPVSDRRYPIGKHPMLQSLLMSQGNFTQVTYSADPLTSRFSDWGPMAQNPTVRKPWFAALTIGFLVAASGTAAIRSNRDRLRKRDRGDALMLGLFALITNAAAAIIVLLLLPSVPRDGVSFQPYASILTERFNKQLISQLIPSTGTTVIGIVLAGTGLIFQFLWWKSLRKSGSSDDGDRRRSP